RAVERGLTDDRDGEDVGRDVPGLIGDDAQLHGWALLGVRSRPASEARRVASRASVPGDPPPIRLAGPALPPPIRLAGPRPSPSPRAADPSVRPAGRRRARKGESLPRRRRSLRIRRAQSVDRGLESRPRLLDAD